MTRTEAENYLQSTFALYGRKRKTDGTIEQPVELKGTGEYVYSYNVTEQLGDVGQTYEVKLRAQGQDADSTALWDRGTPTCKLKSSVASVEAQLKTWIAGNIAGYKGMLPITKSRLGEYPRWVVASCLVESGGSVSTQDYMVYQEEEGQSPVAYPYVSA